MNKWFAGCGNVKLFELHKNCSISIANALEMQHVAQKDIVRQMDGTIDKKL